MKKKIFIALVFLVSIGGAQFLQAQNTSQSEVMIYKKVVVEITSENSFEKLYDLGIEPSEIKGKSCELILSEFEVGVVLENGFDVEIIIPDMTQEFLQRNEANISVYNANKINNDCGGASEIVEYETPANFNLGSMGGFFTLDEVYAEFDQMHELYPNLISALEPVSDFETFEGRNLYSARVSDNPDVDEDEPEQLLTAIHHAREPESISQLIFYVWYLLENYDSDPEVQTILDNTELYIIPLVNPDGYNYNATTNPDGGGFWRKNRRDNGGGSFGVDPNRNYGVAWGTTGISFNTNSDVYPGTEAFSEPETQAVKWFCENHDIKLAFNNHTYSELLLYPYGYEVGEICEDDAYYQIISAHMVSQNGYTDQISAALYPASGDSDDWMYDVTPEKGKIFSFTPEIGYAFWPVSSDIIPIAEEMVFLNLTASHILTDYALVEDESNNLIQSLTPNAEFSIRSIGLDDENEFSVSLEGITANITSVGSPQSFLNVINMQILESSISYVLSGSTIPGDVVEYKFIVNQGGFSTEIFVSKIYGALAPIFSDGGEGMTNWTSGLWDTTTETYYSAPSCFTDSPDENYSNNTEDYMVMNSSMDLTDINSANITFFAKWDIEADYDYVQLLVNDIPQCGIYTAMGVEDQDEDQPLWEGVQSDWVEEFIDLSDYLGQVLTVKFLFVSDGGVTEDGFYFDDFKINTIGAVGVEELFSQNIELNAVPNPATESVVFTWSNTLKLNNATIKITNEIGQLVFEETIENSKSEFQLLVTDFPTGVYFYSIVDNANFMSTKKLIIAR